MFKNVFFSIQPPFHPASRFKMLAAEFFPMRTESVIRKISPSKTETLGVKRLAESTRKSLGKHLPPEAKTLLAGSVAKGTFLKGAGDIDLFAIFPFSYSKEEMFK